MVLLVLTLFRIFAIPNSNDVVPVRNQTLEIDTTNSTVGGEVDAVEKVSSQQEQLTQQLVVIHHTNG